MFSDKPVSTDKADNNFFIYLVDRIVNTNTMVPLISAGPQISAAL